MNDEQEWQLRIPFELPSPDRGLPLPRCGARAKATGAPCRRYVRRGYSRCIVHGAGTEIRTERGERLPPGRTPDAVVLRHLVPESLSRRIRRRTYHLAFGCIHASAKRYQIAETDSPTHRERLKSLHGCRVTIDDGTRLELEYSVSNLARVWEILNTE